MNNRINEQQYDISYSQMLDHNNDQQNTDFSDIQPRIPKSWTKDESATHCQNSECNSLFTFFNRRHHCRLCGKVFCHRCSSHRMVISDLVQRIPERITRWNHYISDIFTYWNNNHTNNHNYHNNNHYNNTHNNHNNHTIRERVCDHCAKKLMEIKKFHRTIQVFNLLPDLTIIDFRNIGLSNYSPLWSQVSNYRLSEFREMQYNLPDHNWTDLERKYMWDNRYLMIGHSIWLIQLFRSIISDPYLTNYQISQRVNQILTALDEWQNELSDIPKIDWYKSRRASCKDLMCTRDCTIHFMPHQAISLIDHRLHNSSLRRLGIKYLQPNKCSLEELKCYIPFLAHQMAWDSVSDHTARPISDFLYDTCIRLSSPTSSHTSTHQPINQLINQPINQMNVSFCQEVWWQVKMEANTHSGSKQEIYLYFLNRLKDNLDESIITSIRNSTKLVTHLKDILDDRDNIKDIEELKDRLDQTINNQKSDQYHLVLPTDPTIYCREIIVDDIKIKQSASRPVCLPFLVNSFPQTQNQSQFQNQILNKNIQMEKTQSSSNLAGSVKMTAGDAGCSVGEDTYNLLWKSEDVRKDQIIVKIIKWIDLTLKTQLNLDLNILTYVVLPLSADTGLIEMVPNCETIYSIRENRQFSILNYIIENNRKLTVEELRKRFVRSCAAYCVITYLLGIGDRHLDNIMVTHSGRIFHIDFGYILGNDPKPMSFPKMRITPEMIDALGGKHSKFYHEFVDLCNQIYNCLRRYIEVFIHLLTPLAEMGNETQYIQPQNKSNKSNKLNKTNNKRQNKNQNNQNRKLTYQAFRRDQIIQELVRRFVPGESTQQAEFEFTQQIETSGASYDHMVHDLIHHHRKEDTISTLVSGTYQMAADLVSLFW